MDTTQLSKLIAGEILNNTEGTLEISCAFASDLMSDVLRWHDDNMVLITGLATIQALRTAEISGIPCIVFARGKHVTEEMLELARESNIIIISSPQSMYEVSGKLYTNGIKPLF